MHLEEHCKECLYKLGEEHREVHKWLDEFFNELGPAHRAVRHHAGGVEEVRQKWGQSAADAAILHIKSDCHGKIPTEAEAKISSLFS